EASERKLAELRARVRAAPVSPAALDLFDLLSAECRWAEAEAHVASMCAALLGRPDGWVRPFRFLLYRDEPALHLELASRFSRAHETSRLAQVARPSSPKVRIAY